MNNDAALRKRAERVIPGGMYGHMSVYRKMPAGYPQYYRRADGCRLWDVDGNEYIDFMCAFGPMIAGYGNPRIAAAAGAQRDLLDIANGPPPAIVDLAERFVRQVSHADWAIFAKNGNDATTMCHGGPRQKREAQHPGRDRRLPRLTAVGESAVARHAGTGPRVFSDLHLQRRRQPTATAAAVSGDLAGIVVSAFKHDAGYHQELPDPAFARAARAICDAEGARSSWTMCAPDCGCPWSELVAAGNPA